MPKKYAAASMCRLSAFGLGYGSRFLYVRFRRCRCSCPVAFIGLVFYFCSRCMCTRKMEIGRQLLCIYDKLVALIKRKAQKIMHQRGGLLWRMQDKLVVLFL